MNEREEALFAKEEAREKKRGDEAEVEKKRSSNRGNRFFFLSHFSLSQLNTLSPPSCAPTRSRRWARRMPGRPRRARLHRWTLTKAPRREEEEEASEGKRSHQHQHLRLADDAARERPRRPQRTAAAARAIKQKTTFSMPPR